MSIAAIIPNRCACEHVGRGRGFRRGLPWANAGIVANAEFGGPVTAMTAACHPGGMDPHLFVKGFHGIRYQVKDVARAVDF